MALNVPKKYQPGLARIRRLSAGSLSELVSALRIIPPVSSSDELSKAIAGKLETISEEDAGEIAATLFSMYFVRGHREISARRFVSELIPAMQDAGRDADLCLADDEVPQFRDRMTQLLEIEPLETVSKLVGLCREFPRNFCDARVLTDVRPVFTDAPGDGPAAATVVHNLKIEYHEGDDHREFYVALDSEDIETLREALDRAAAKAQALQKVLKQAGLLHLDV